LLHATVDGIGTDGNSDPDSVRSNRAPHRHELSNLDVPAIQRETLL